MDLRPYKNPENKQGGPLKTTTWGALIASRSVAGWSGIEWPLLPFARKLASY